MPYGVDVGVVVVPKRSSRVISMSDLTIIVVGIECESEVGGLFYDPFSNQRHWYDEQTGCVTFQSQLCMGTSICGYLFIGEFNIRIL